MIKSAVLKKQIPQGQIYIGTSGWMYKDWGERFYPKDMKSGFLTYLSREFNTVEVNSSFYHLPKPETFAKWKKETDDGFVFAVKISRYITHRRRLKDCREPILNYFLAAKRLGPKLGPTLVQLPPSLPYEAKTFELFLKDLDFELKRTKAQALLALEPREQSWFEEEHFLEIKQKLKKRNIALVFANSAKIPSAEPEEENLTASFAYIRFHGPSEFASSEYGKAMLRPWANRIKRWQRRGLKVYVYFNNDVNGMAVHDARTLKELLE